MSMLALLCFTIVLVLEAKTDYDVVSLKECKFDSDDDGIKYCYAVDDDDSVYYQSELVSEGKGRKGLGIAAAVFICIGYAVVEASKVSMGKHNYYSVGVATVAIIIGLCSAGYADTGTQAVLESAIALFIADIDDVLMDHAIEKYEKDNPSSSSTELPNVVANPINNA